MTLFESIVSELLTEDVNVGKINDAITRSYEVEINYQSDNDNASGPRRIQVVAYGLTKAGKPAIRAYQPFGDTQTSVPSWKLFLVSGIQSWKPYFKKVFNQPPPGYNPSGDNGMSTVYKIAKFWTKPEEDASAQPKPIKASGPVKKTDIDTKKHISVQDNPEIKKMDKLRKQLDNPKYISDIIKNKTFDSDIKQNDNSHMIANSGPVSKDSFTTNTEKDIESRYNQMNKNERVSQDVLNQWEKEQEKRKKKLNYGSNRNGVK